MATSRNSTEKTTKSYPVRQWIPTEKAIENILNWIGNDDAHFDDDSMSDSDNFSEEDSISSNYNVNDFVVENDSDKSESESELQPEQHLKDSNTSTKRKRGCPSGENSNKRKPSYNNRDEIKRQNRTLFKHVAW